MFERSRRSAAAKLSAEPVRAVGLEVITFLADQGLEPTPANYELGYRYRTDRDGLVARAVDAVLMTGDPFSQEQADRIIEQHLRVSPSETAERGRMRTQALHLADLAADAVAATGQFGRDLAGDLGQLGDECQEVSSVVTAMIDRTRDTEQALAQASREIEALRQEVEAARGDAARDALTGLHNRRGIEEELRGLKKLGKSVVAICDVDHFKSINDRYGHAVGDRVLKLVASSLAQSCDPHLVARWGGEEFIVLMNGVDLDGAAAMVDSARVELAGRNLRLRETDEPLGNVTFSAGVAPLNGRKFDEAVNDADALLYRAKHNGRDQVVI